jgi:hypothetical protein
MAENIDDVLGDIDGIAELLALAGNAAISGVEPAPQVSLPFLANSLSDCRNRIAAIVKERPALAAAA